jgi:hypothetical protein
MASDCTPCSNTQLSTPTGGAASQCQPGPRGPRGVAGSGGAAGTNGLHAFTLSTADFIMPAVNASVSVSVGNGSWIGTGQIIYVEGAGYFSASSPAAGSVTLTNLGYGPNAAPATNIEAGAIVSPGGPKGANAPDDARGYILIRRELPSNTDGGTFTQGSWQARLVNTIVFDTQSQVIELNSGTGVFKIKARKYKVRCEAPGFDVNRHRSRLRNITSGGEIYGTSEFTGDLGQSNSVVIGSLNLGVDTEFILESRCQTTKATTGLGNASNFGTAEVYEFIELIEVP